MAETAFEPDWFSRPGDTVHALMTKKGLSTEELASRLHLGQSKIRGLLTGAIEIDESLAAQLADVVGGTTRFWQSRQAGYARSLAKAAAAVPNDNANNWLNQLPLNAMAASGWLARMPSRSETLQSCLAYFGVTSPEEWRRRYAAVSADIAFRTSPSFESSLGPMSAWIRQAEIEASLMSCAQWNKEALEDRLDSLRRLTLLREPQKFLPRLKQICAAAGVALVILRAPKGCHASGATRFISSNRAMIILSVRYLSEDHFWFTFFHELAHLLLHGKSATFVDLTEDGKDEKEREANHFSSTMLVPIARQEEMSTLNGRDGILRFAASIGTSPGIVVGQMQHQGWITRASLNFLKRRYDWEDIEAALAC